MSADSALRSFDVNAACARCHREGIVVQNLRELGSESPNSWLLAVDIVGSWLVIGAALRIVGGQLDLFGDVVGGARQRGWTAVSWMVLIGMVYVASSMIGRVPFRILLCTGCKRVLSVRLGSRVPSECLRVIAPLRSRPTCGHSLSGSSGAPRCPECGTALPESWLPVIRDPAVRAEIFIRVEP